MFFTKENFVDFLNKMEMDNQIEERVNVRGNSIYPSSNPKERKRVERKKAARKRNRLNEPKYNRKRLSAEARHPHWKLTGRKYLAS